MSYSTGIELSKKGKRSTLKDALAKTYLVKATGRYSSGITLPGVLEGKRIKLILVEEVI
jgi:hypothetical protein